MRKRPALTFLVVFLAVVVGPDLHDILKACGTGIPPMPFPYGRSLLYNLLAVAIAFGAAIGLKRQALPRVFDDLGLRWNGHVGPGLTLLATLPCWVGLGVAGKLSTDFTVLDLLFPALLFPFAEELVFRGFGFIFTHRVLRWPFRVSVYLQALVFGLDHWIGAGASGAVALHIFLLTALGGVLFAILDVLGGYTIWNGWIWHSSVNAAWTVFAVSDTAAAGWFADVLRFGSLGLALLLLFFGRALSGKRPPDKSVEG
jgi:uncharacterized protein